MNRQTKNGVQRAGVTQSSKSKRAYQQPKLIRHGHVSHLTLGNGSIADDEGAVSRLI